MSFIDRWVYKNKTRQSGVNNTGTQYNPTTITPQEQFKSYQGRRNSDTQPNLKNVPYTYFHRDEVINVRGDDGQLHGIRSTADGYIDDKNQKHMVGSLQPDTWVDRKGSIGSIGSIGSVSSEMNE
ncbi:hypothetical protein KL949_001234 [Ogataea haglerorum]|nr:hypothetical protein KL913_001624 [Ogataea haglerorum]KAG7721502.1 hypothetical protein KL949_001234 [Ogataea haglerorum]KAG7769832.1 hypothetical protein KL931_002351 [Ogataea haglerorum]